MATTTFTRSIAIVAPVKEVFDFVGDPERRFSTWPMAVTVGQARRTPEGVGTTYTWSGGSEWDLSLDGSMTWEAHIPDERIVERSSTGSVWDWTVHPEGQGTRLTVMCDHSVRTQRRGVDLGVMRMTPRGLEQMLAAIKENLERR